MQPSLPLNPQPPLLGSLDWFSSSGSSFSHTPVPRSPSAAPPAPPSGGRTPGVLPPHQPGHPPRLHALPLRDSGGAGSSCSRKGSPLVHIPTTTSITKAVIFTCSALDVSYSAHCVLLGHKYTMKQVHSLCVDSRPGDRLRLAKGPPSSSLILSM